MTALVATCDAHRHVQSFMKIWPWTYSNYCKTPHSQVLACDPSQCSFLFFIFYVASGGGVEALGDGDQGAQKWRLKSGTGSLIEAWSSHLTNLGLATFKNFEVCSVHHQLEEGCHGQDDGPVRLISKSGATLQCRYQTPPKRYKSATVNS